MPADAPGDPDAAKAARTEARRERKLRAEQRYQLLETARKERRAKARSAFADAARLPRLPRGRVLAGVATGLILLVILSVWSATRSRKTSLLTRSCTTPAIALGRATTGDGLGIAWAVTGPQAGAYSVLVDGRVVAQPRFNDCRADGALPPLPPGSHRVELRRDDAPAATALLAP